jgi:hypothetical protein
MNAVVHSLKIVLIPLNMGLLNINLPLCNNANNAKGKLIGTVIGLCYFNSRLLHKRF